MILAALGLIGFGVADLVRWSPEKVGPWHAAAAAGAGTVAVVAVGGLSGMGEGAVVRAAVVALAVLVLWSGYDLLPERHARPEYALALVTGAIIVLFALGGSAEPIQGDMASWYSGLEFSFVKEVSADQFVLGVGTVLFLMATGNRLVRFTLAATKTSLARGEGALRGGRVLGPMERLIVVAAVVSGSVAGAGFVIAAKGLLRFREIRGTDQASAPSRLRRIKQPRVDEITEYFLIGTFTSVLVAGVIGILVLAGG